MEQYNAPVPRTTAAQRTARHTPGHEEASQSGRPTTQDSYTCQTLHVIIIIIIIIIKSWSPPNIENHVFTVTNHVLKITRRKGGSFWLWFSGEVPVKFFTVEKKHGQKSIHVPGFSFLFHTPGGSRQVART